MNRNEYRTQTILEPAAAMLDRETEEALYRHYRAFFHTAENTRNWNPWTDIPWDQVSIAPSPALAEAVLASYREDVFLPDYTVTMLHTLRSSRGRAWFATRWSYEEGKHLLTLGEWLVRSGTRTDDELKVMADELLYAYRWEAPFPDPTAVLADALAWEMREIERYRALHHLASEEGDAALTGAIRRLLADEEAHQAFFLEALEIIARMHGELVTDAVRRVATAQGSPAHAHALLTAFDAVQ